MKGGGAKKKAMGRAAVYTGFGGFLRDQGRSIGAP